ncbi:MAG TPA: response regulator [Burkholderiales bacterium]|jgi:DNA-binding response OmpR family regulator|nr:response regulator [Burkholderiales bacterium]
MRRVLLVEDDDLVSRLLEETLRMAGYDVECAATFGEGKAKLQQGKYDLIISDVILPGGLGTDLAPIAEALGVKYFAVSGQPDQTQALETTKHHYLAKPFRPGAFIEQINRIWEGE